MIINAPNKDNSADKDDSEFNPHKLSIKDLEAIARLLSMITTINATGPAIIEDADLDLLNTLGKATQPSTRLIPFILVQKTLSSTSLASTLYETRMQAVAVKPHSRKTYTSGPHKATAVICLIASSIAAAIRHRAATTPVIVAADLINTSVTTNFRTKTSPSSALYVQRVGLREAV